MQSQRDNRQVIVIRRDGQTTTLTGWRAWLAGAGAFVLATAFLWIIAFVLLGLAITIGTILLIVVPVVVAVAIVWSLIRTRRDR